MTKYRYLSLLIVATALAAGCAQPAANRPAPSQPAAQPPAPAVPVATPAPTGPGPEPTVIEVNKAVMVTVNLDFGGRVPTIAEALREVERRYEPDDRQGRTFAILDAYGEPTPDGKLHMSMHVSTEKAGKGSLVFRRTGEVLWRGQITPGGAAPAFGGKQLRIMVDDGKGTTRLLDGTKQPPTIMDAIVNDLKIPLRDFWPEGAEREVTFVYSACGCPVKVMAKRVGNRTMRTKDLPVIFPDDPPAAQTIAGLMGWQ
jgi:hypothetical protein